MTAADILWNDIGLYQARYEKTASALIAISQALERNHPLGGGEAEFLELYRQMVAADPEAFTTVWRDPTSYYWVRLAYEFVGNCLSPAPLSTLAETAAREMGASDPGSALELHLSDFKRFVLALGLVSGSDQKFSTPLKVTLPFAIPSSRLVVDGAGYLLIHALRDGCLEVTYGENRRMLPLTPASTASADSLNVRHSPVAEADGYSVLLQPEALFLPGLKESEALRMLASSFQAQYAGVTAQALELIHRHCPQTFEHFRGIVRLIALKPSGAGEYSNVSHSDLPGSFIVSVANDPYMMADFFVHEFHHNRFFFVEELGAFFADDRDNLMTRNEFYSPFRDDLRPLHGIFHGLYVYLAVWRFWFAVHRSGETSGLRRAAAIEQILAISIQLAMAVDQLRRNARFTPHGALLFEAMAEESSRIQQMTRGLDFPADVPSIRCDDDGVFSIRRDAGSDQPLSVRRALLRHAEKFDLHRQISDLDAIIRASFGST